MNDDIDLGRKHDFFFLVQINTILLPLVAYYRCVCVEFFLLVENFRKINKILVCDCYTNTHHAGIIFTPSITQRVSIFSHNSIKKRTNKKIVPSLKKMYLFILKIPIHIKKT